MAKKATAAKNRVSQAISDADDFFFSFYPLRDSVTRGLTSHFTPTTSGIYFHHYDFIGSKFEASRVLVNQMGLKVRTQKTNGPNKAQPFYDWAG